jgi:hypothetical protein
VTPNERASYNCRLPPPPRNAAWSWSWRLEGVFFKKNGKLEIGVERIEGKKNAVRTLLQQHCTCLSSARIGLGGSCDRLLITNSSNKKSKRMKRERGDSGLT